MVTIPMLCRGFLAQTQGSGGGAQPAANQSESSREVLRATEALRMTVLHSVAFENFQNGRQNCENAPAELAVADDEAEKVLALNECGVWNRLRLEA